MSCHPLLSLLLWIPVQKWSVGHSVPEHRDGESVSSYRPFPLGSPWALRVLTFCCAEGSLLEMPTLGGVFQHPVPLMLPLTDLGNLKVVVVRSSFITKSSVQDYPPL